MQEDMCDKLLTNAEIVELLEETKQYYNNAVEAQKQVKLATTEAERQEMQQYAESLQDLAEMAMKNYMAAKHAQARISSLEGAVIPVDNVMHSLFNGIDILMNGELVSTTNQKYMYKAYIETILNNSASTKKYQLRYAGYFGDNGNRDEMFNLTFNEGMERRYKTFMDKKSTPLMGFLLSDIMGIQASIVNGVEIEIILNPNTDKMRVQAFGNKKYGRVIIDDIMLYVCKRTFSKEVILDHSELMQKNEAVYPFKKTEIRAYNGNAGNTQVTIENPYESKIPTRFIVGMIDADAYIGHWQKTPLNFKHFDISKASFYIDDESVAKPPYKLDPARYHFVEPMMELYHILGKAGEDQDIGIGEEEYVEGLFLLPFDVTPTAAGNMEYLSKGKPGNCRIELEFRKPLPHNIIILTYAIFPAELRIDGARNCRVGNV